MHEISLVGLLLSLNCYIEEDLRKVRRVEAKAKIVNSDTAHCSIIDLFAR